MAHQGRGKRHTIDSEDRRMPSDQLASKNEVVGRLPSVSGQLKAVADECGVVAYSSSEFRIDR